MTLPGFLLNDALAEWLPRAIFLAGFEKSADDARYRAQGWQDKRSAPAGGLLQP